MPGTAARRAPPRPGVSHTRPPARGGTSAHRDRRDSVRAPHLRRPRAPDTPRFGGGPDGGGLTSEPPRPWISASSPSRAAVRITTQRKEQIGSRSRLRSRGNQRSRGDRARTMAVPDEAGARDKGRSRWEGSARWGSAGHAAILRFGLRPGLDRPGPVLRQAS